MFCISIEHFYKIFVEMYSPQVRILLLIHITFVVLKILVFFSVTARPKSASVSIFQDKTNGQSRQQPRRDKKLNNSELI